MRLDRPYRLGQSPACDARICMLTNNHRLARYNAPLNRTIDSNSAVLAMPHFDRIMNILNYNDSARARVLETTGRNRDARLWPPKAEEYAILLAVGPVLRYPSRADHADHNDRHPMSILRSPGYSPEIAKVTWT